MKKYQLKNTYLLMRHAESVANRDGIIVSESQIGISEFGLTDEGVQSVATQALNSRLDSDVIIYCSDFLRTTQTANIMSDVLDAKKPVANIALRERFFGYWDGRSSESYPNVWAQDLQDEYPNQVETVTSVLRRMVNCLLQLEEAHQGEMILLVSHGDSLQILLSWFRGLEATEHRSIPSMKPANIRLLKCNRTLDEMSLIGASSDEVKRSAA